MVDKYRAVVYFMPHGRGSYTLFSDAVGTIKEADQLLSQLLALPGFTGGHLQARMPEPFGWISVDDEEDAENMVDNCRISLRLREEECLLKA